MCAFIGVPTDECAHSSPGSRLNVRIHLRVSRMNVLIHTTAQATAENATLPMPTIRPGCHPLPSSLPPCQAHRQRHLRLTGRLRALTGGRRAPVPPILSDNAALLVGNVLARRGSADAWSVG